MRLKPSQRRTRGQGVDQSTILPAGGGEGRGKDTKKPERLGKSLSSLSSRCGTLAIRRHTRPTLALGVWWVTCCHSCHPSFAIPVILHPHRKALCLVVVSVCVCRGDHSHALFVATLRPHHPLHSSHTGYGPRLWGVLFSILVCLVQPLVDGRVSAASLKSSPPP